MSVHFNIIVAIWSLTKRIAYSALGLVLVVL